MKTLPVDRLVVRALCGPALVVAAAAHVHGAALAAIVTLAFLLEVYDGIVARRSGAASRASRYTDTILNAVFYACATVTLVFRIPVDDDYVMCIAAIVALALGRWLLDRMRYGRMTAYHMWSARAWGILLWLGFSEVFLTGRTGAWFEAALIVGMLTQVEGLGASLVLSSWRPEVPTLWHAIQIERGITVRLPGDSSSR